MTRIELLNKLIDKAKDNGYAGPDYSGEIGFIMDGTNFYSLIFREDFAKAIWGNKNIDVVMHGMHETMESHLYHLTKLVQSEDKWAYLEKEFKL
ncbi:MAG: hypothetical protein AABY15_05475 [Nanoarchaeota archaeon]